MFDVNSSEKHYQHQESFSIIAFNLYQVFQFEPMLWCLISCCAAHWYLAYFIFCVNQGFFCRPVWLQTLLQKTFIDDSLVHHNTLICQFHRKFLHEALLFFNAIALIFQSSLGVVFLLRQHYHPWIVYLSSQFQCFSCNANSLSWSI